MYVGLLNEEAKILTLGEGRVEILHSKRRKWVEN